MTAVFAPPTVAKPSPTTKRPLMHWKSGGCHRDEKIEPRLSQWLLFV